MAIDRESRAVMWALGDHSEPVDRFELGSAWGDHIVVGRTAKFVIFHNPVNGSTYRRKVHVEEHGREYIVAYRTSRTLYVRYADIAA